MAARHPGCTSLGRSSGVTNADGQAFCIDCHTYFTPAEDVRHVAGQIVVPMSWVCAFCHGVKVDGMSAVIHATRFKPGATEGYQVAYWFCDDGCKQAWLDRPETTLSANTASKSDTP